MLSDPSHPIRTSHYGKPVISQAQLNKLLRLRRETRRCKTLTRELIRLLEEGAEIEHGSLAAHIERRLQRRLTVGALMSLLGKDQVESLRREVEPTLYRKLLITDYDWLD